MQPTKVAIVDDHKLFRDGLSGLIQNFEGFEVLIEADNGSHFINQTAEYGIPDIVLLDINMKGMDGFQTAQWLRSYHPEVKFLVLSMYENENSVIRMLKLGARGYILKDIRKSELQQALSSLVTKGYYYTEKLTGRLIHNLGSSRDIEQPCPKDEISRFSEREVEFLKWACTELTYKEIAREMRLSIHTVDSYRDNLFAKLELKSRIGLVLFAIRNRIVFIE
jgi:two-component system, NarL family, invasion response regulator UvrY